MNGRKPDDRLSTKPQAIRARARAKKAKFQTDVELYYQHTGYKPVDQWDLEELARGKPRGPDGRWKTGATPRWLTPEIQQQVRDRFRERAFDGLAEYLPQAIKVLGELMVSEETDLQGKPLVSARDRLDIAKFIVEHVIGKAKQKLDITGTPAYRRFLADAMTLPDGSNDYAGQIVDGEVVDDDGDLPDV